MYKSKIFYIKVSGDYAMWTSAHSKTSGDRTTYQVPTKEALRGIADACYFKPTFINRIDEVKVINQIKTETMGARTLLNKGGTDLNNSSYLRDVCYLVKFHFEWNLDREDLVNDRNIKKHEAIMERSLKRGGRRDVFLGTRECYGFVEKIDKVEYEQAKSFYEGQNLSFGIMFSEFIYPTKPGKKLISCFTDTTMNDGVIKFKDSKDCEIKNTLDTYSFKYPDEIKSVDVEYEEYENFEDGGLWMN